MRKSRTARRRHRKSARKAQRKALRRSRRATRHRGGAALMAAELNESGMVAPGVQSLAQGGQFMQMNKNFHGGSAPLNAIGAGFLTPDMASAARVGSLDAAMREIAGMQDGGRRRRRHRGGSHRRGHKTGRKSHRKSGHKSQRKVHRKSQRKVHRKHRMRGGAAFVPSEVAASPMLLSGSEYNKAGLNPEWRYVESNAMAYAPK